VSPPLEQRLNGDTSFERLYRRHRRDVYGAVLRDVRDPDEAEDVTQIAFMNAFRAIRRGERPDKPRAWLVTIARNVVRRRYQALARRPQEVALDPEVAADLTDVNGPTAGEIAAAIRHLPPNQRAVILLREIQGRSYAEIAEELDLSLAAVETLIFRARGSLGQELQLADHVPTTQPTRRLRGLLALPLPGLGKLSLGFSVSRASVAAFVGGAAIVAVPVTDMGAKPPSAPALQRAPSRAETIGASVAPGIAFLPLEKATQAKRSKITVQPGVSGSSGESADNSSSGGGILPSLPLPSVDPSSDVSLPALPVEPPPLPVEPPPLPVEPPPLPVEPPPLPVEPSSLPVEPLPLPVEPLPLPVELPPLPPTPTP
jgi:RNA polymerase sigma factor (sigma-70 family)